MRLTAFEVQRYGNFDRMRLAFDSRPGCINLVAAPNGAGKSVLLRAICDLLYGIPARTPMDFRHGYANMRLFAEAVDGKGATLRFGRRKGMGNTLIDADGAALAPEALRPLLGEVDQPMLERLFVLGTDRLRQGGEELLKSDGALGEALLAAAGGLREAHTLKEWLAAERDKAAPLRRSQTRPFYKGLDALQEAQRRLKQEIWQPKEWLEQERTAAAAEARRIAARAEAEAAGAAITRLERIRRVRPLLAEADEARAWLAANPGAPALDAALAPRFRTAREKLALATAALEAAERQRRGLAEQLGAVVPDGALLAEAEPIARLAEELGAAERAAAGLPRLEAALADAEARIRGLLRQIGADHPPAEAAALLPATPDSVAARGLIGAAEGAATAVAKAAERVEVLRRRLTEARAALASLPADGAEVGLQRLLREIREAGEPAAAATAARTAVETARAAVTATLARAAPWPGTAEALRALPVAPLPAFERVAATFATAEARRRTAAEARDAALADATDAARRLAELQGRAALPEDGALPRARRHRDTGWRLIHQLAFTPTPPGPEAVAEFAGAEALDLAYDRALRDADGLADRIAAEATRLGEAQAIRAEAVGLAARGQAAEAALAAAEAEYRAAADTWAAACAPLGLPGDASLAELRGLLAGRDRVVTVLEALATAEAAAVALQARQESWAARLAAALGRPAAALAVLLDAAEARLDAARAQATERARQDTMVGDLARQLAEAEVEAEAAAQRRAAWAVDWEAALARLGRPAGEAPAETRVVLDLLDSLAAAVQQAAADAAAARRDRLLVEGFQAEALALLARLPPGSPEPDPYAALRALRDRLTPAQEAAAKQALLRGQLEKAEAAKATRAAALDAAEAEWRAVLALLGAGSEAEAEARLALAAQRRDHAQTLARTAAALREAGDGLSEAALATEAAAVPAEALPQALEAAREAAAAAQDTAEQAAGEVQSIRQAIRIREQAVAAVDAKADEQAAVALLGRTLEEALVLQVAGGLLEDALRSVEVMDSPRLLQRITQVFRRLTRGAMERVVTEEAESGQIRLAVVEPPDAVPKPVAALSEGSRDQLFLALRIIAIEDHLAGAPPLPFIADDILQTFDDGRALAAFEALLELSHKVQVIVLTHHEHLVALAGRLPPGAVALQRLVTPEPALG
jgi:uncharacterized protein YhaN